MLILQGVTYTHPNKDLLFSGIHLSVNRQDKIAIVGNNGAGKSMLLKILAGQLLPSSGIVKTDADPWYVPQLFGQYDEFSVAAVLKIEDKLMALQEILDGRVTEKNLALLDEDWDIEERMREALVSWRLDGIDAMQKMSSLSAGQKTKVFLAGTVIHQPEIVLLDEPSNHLDSKSRDLLYEYIRSTKSTLVVVSHDRRLLNLPDKICELSKSGVSVYGGNYDFYAEQKRIESDALLQDVRNQEKALRKAKEAERETLQRQQKLDARGKKKQEKAGLPTISMNTFRNNAEKSTARVKGDHAEKVGSIAKELDQLRSGLPAADKMKLDFDNSALHLGKILVTLKEINFSYGDQLHWKHALSAEIRSGERIAIKGPNGSGKTTLLKMIMGEWQPQSGVINRAYHKIIYIDQDYTLANQPCSVYELAQIFNTGGLQEHEIKIRLNRFLFTKDDWDKHCKVLSGGERMRLLLCCLTIDAHSPDIIILDEPTNNLDIQNVEILTTAINEYKGTLLVVSHDEAFLEDISVSRVIEGSWSG